MTNVWAVADSYWQAAEHGVAIDAQVFWRRRDADDVWQARGPVKPFTSAHSIGFEGDLKLPVPSSAPAFHPIHLRVEQVLMATDHPEALGTTLFTLAGLAGGPTEHFSHAWQAAPNCAYMEEEPSRRVLGAVVTFDRHFSFTMVDVPLWEIAKTLRSLVPHIPHVAGAENGQQVTSEVGG